MNKHEIDKLQLMRYVSDDCDATAQAGIENHLQVCAVCRACVEQLHREKQTFLAALPFDSYLTKPAAQTAKKKKSAFRYYALAASFVMLLAGGAIFHSSKTPDGYRMKGKTAIALYTKRADGVIEKREMQLYYPGERVQITYSCARYNNLLLLSIDEKGKISIYYPQQADSSVSLEKGTDIPLPNSIVLDEYIGKELFLAVFSDRRWYLPEIKQELGAAFLEESALDKIQLPDNKHRIVKTILITKAEKK